MAEGRSPIREPRRVDVVFSDGHWLAAIAGDSDREFDCQSLSAVIAAVHNAHPGEALLFVVDRLTLNGNFDAEAQLLEASENSGALVISSVHEFSSSKRF